MYKRQLLTTGQSPGAGSQIITGDVVAEFRTNGIIKRVRMNAGGQEGRYEDQTRHTSAQYVTGTGAGAIAGYKLVSGVGINLHRNPDSSWTPQIRLRVELEGSTQTLDVTQAIVH